MNYKLIIPSAKLVPEELRGIGELPGIIYPINEKIVFDYIREQYITDNLYVDIVCYEAVDKVKRRLNHYLNDFVQIKTLPELKDLGHTIYYAIKSTTTPIIINFSDTIVLDNIIGHDGDVLFYAEDYLSNIWTFFEDNDGVITDISDKEYVSDDGESQKKKLFVGVFKIIDTVYFKECLEKAFEEKKLQMNSFYYALFLYSKTHPISFIKTDNWFDIGHADTYFNSELEVKAREFNHITIDKNRGILRKSSDDIDKFIGEIKWYIKLPADVEYVRPRIFSYSIDYESPYILMEYYAYHTIHELFLYGDLTKKQWVDIFRRISFVCNDFKRYTVSGNDIKDALKDMYLEKTLLRLDKIKNDKRFNNFFENKIVINKNTYKSLSDIQNILIAKIPELLYDVDSFNIIHGDLCFSNIMIDRDLSFVKVIDPRGKFGSYDIYGDFRYELAKLFHSVDGKYDFIIKDLFTVNFDIQKPSIEFQISDRKRKFNIYNTFIEVFKEDIGKDLKKIEFIEALLFLTMIPLHNESFEHQLVMLGTGIEILNRVIDIREE